MRFSGSKAGARIPAEISALRSVSILTNTSSEVIHALLPVYTKCRKKQYCHPEAAGFSYVGKPQKDKFNISHRSYHVNRADQSRFYTDFPHANIRGRRFMIEAIASHSLKNHL